MVLTFKRNFDKNIRKVPFYPLYYIFNTLKHLAAFLDVVLLNLRYNKMCID